MAAFPIFLTPSAGTALVIGSGRIAAHKAAALKEAGFAVETKSSEAFDATSVTDFALVVAATSDRSFNRKVSEACRARNVLVNVVDDPELCTFYFGSTLRKGPITVSVSTDGTCPAAGQVLRDRIRPLLTDGFVQTAERLGAERATWKETWPDPSARGAAMRKEFEKC